MQSSALFASLNRAFTGSGRKWDRSDRSLAVWVRYNGTQWVPVAFTDPTKFPAILRTADVQFATGRGIRLNSGIVPTFFLSERAALEHQVEHQYSIGKSSTNWLFQWLTPIIELGHGFHSCGWLWSPAPVGTSWGIPLLAHLQNSFFGLCSCYVLILSPSYLYLYIYVYSNYSPVYHHLLAWHHHYIYIQYTSS